jgi:hypothetical protein
MDYNLCLFGENKSKTFRNTLILLWLSLKKEIS